MNVFLLVLTIRRLVQMRWMSTFSSMHVHPWLSQSSRLSCARTSRSVDVVLYLEFLLCQLVTFLEIHLCYYNSLCVYSCLSIALVFLMCLLNVKCEMSLINEISDIGLHRPSYKVPRFQVHVPGFVSVSSFYIFQQNKACSGGMK